MEKQTKFIVLCLLLFVIGSSALAYWFVFGKPAPVPKKEEPVAAAKPAESVDWNKVFYEPSAASSPDSGTLSLGTQGAQ